MGGVDRKIMRALVTGSDGFIGQNLVKRLRKMGMDVVCIDKYPKKLCTMKLDVATKDFIKYITLQNVEFDYVFHFGSPCSVIQFNQDPFYCIDNTLRGFINVLELTERWNAKLIYPSSGNVYGAHKGLHHELLQPKPINLYGMCKCISELMANRSNIETIGLRVYAGYGHGEEIKVNVASVIYLFLRDMMKNVSPVIWGDGTQTRDFIHIDDVVNGIVKSMRLNRTHIINVATGRSHSYNEIIDIINKILDTDILPVYKSKPKNYVDKTRADITLMKKLLGLTPLTLEEGITKFVDYLEN